MRVVRLYEHDWATLRDARLRALADAPSAFWATHADEAAYGEEQWRGFARAAAWYVARRDGAVVGLAAGLIRPEAPDEPELIAVWVDPDKRRHGTATALVHQVQAWGRRQKARTLALWVTEDNSAASALYDRLGFRFTGERAPLPRDPSIAEVRMRAALTGTGALRRATDNSAAPSR